MDWQNFILAGAAIFTMVGKASRFTYRVSRKDPEPGSRYTQPTYFVGLLAGPDNTKDYRYLGILDPLTGYVRLTRNSKVTPSAPSVKAIQWAFPRLWQHAPMPESFAIHHEGHCGKCGKKLTVPESILCGFGPECRGDLGIAKVSIKKTAVSKAYASAHGLSVKDSSGDFDGTEDYREASVGASASAKGFGSGLFDVAFEEAR